MPRRHRLPRFIAVVLLVLGLGMPAQPVRAATVVVNSLLDDGPGNCAAKCTLRDAIATAAPGSTIHFSVSGTIPLASTLTLTKNVTVQGPGPGSLAVSGQGTVRVLFVNSGVHAGLHGLTITGGFVTVSIGAGIANYGTLSIANSTVSGNDAIVAGGIYNAGLLNVTNSTIVGNSTGPVSGISRGGGIYNSATLTVVGSSISNNIAAGNGGAIYSDGIVSLISSTVNGNSGQTGIHLEGASASIVNSTVSGNTGSAIRVMGPTSIVNSTVTNNSASTAIFVGGPAELTYFPSLELRNSIVAGKGTLVSLGNNLSDTTACVPGATQGDIVTASPFLGPLALHSPGTTATHALLPGSPAIDGVTFNPGDCGTTVATDQRGVPRPQIQSDARCDIGSYELTGNTRPTISSIANQATNEDVP